MPLTRHSHAASRPISGGNAITLAVVLYRSHLRQYLTLSGIASLWAILPFVVGALLIGLGIALNPFERVDAAFGWIIVIILVVLLWLFLFAWCVAQSLRNLGLISRLAYRDLEGQPEPLLQARKQIRSGWWFLLMQFLLGLILQAVSMVLQVVSFPLVGVASLLSGLFRVSGLGMGIELILTFITGLAFFSFYLWVYARFFIPEVPLSVEPQTDGITALGRSWVLSGGSVGRILLVLSVATFIIAPLYGLSLIPLSIGIGVGVSFWQNPGRIEPGMTALAIGGFVLVMVLSIVVINLFVMPFWQTLKAVLYYDLRIRKEGLGLQLPDRPPQV